MAPRARSAALQPVLGNPSRRRVKKRGPRADAGVPRRPGWLSPAAKAKFRDLARRLARRGLLTPLDGDALAAYCEVYAQFRATTETLQSQGRDYTDGEGTVRAHPAFGQWVTTLKLMRQYGSVLALDPASREKMGVGEPEQKDALSEFLQ
jgi:P27 family predicted phage terminase small subunit